ncbi:hypothetical protein L1049_026437 [Liquidambar formosana]|uniref:Fungal lipase-type domain-containing protein n=1 Tax=Liquidambar formosana TaxID=63359 RepID=A0AAP0NES2_LIQFO
MSYEEKYCVDYLVLKPEKASLFDLVRILASRDLKDRAFVEHPEEELIDARRRWLIFISLLLQKALLYWRRPMAFIGFVITLWLNLVSINGGLRDLLLNLLKGKVVLPKSSSATFTSVVGNVDKRVELDRSIKHGSSQYNTALSIMAAKLSYENEAFIQTIVRDHWQMDFVGFYNFWNDYEQRFSTQAFMLRDTSSDPDLIVVAFRGTDPFDADDWRTDVDISWYELQNIGKMHSGFMKALGQQMNKGWPKEIEEGPLPYAYYTIRRLLGEMLGKNERAKFILTGHSLGGALAILFVAVLGLHEEAWMLERLEGVYTFGQPRVGDKQFGDFMMEKLKQYDVKYFRYVYCNDIVPRLPYDDTTTLFKHFGACLYYNSCYKGKVLWEEPNKNYFSLYWVIPKFLNAVWELVRSFIIPYTEGPDYREEWLMKMIRVFGLAIPGISAHLPQDYDNVTRLGSVPLPLQLQDPIHET